MSSPIWATETPIECATRLGISHAAAELFQASDVIDLHVDSFIWNRIIGYRLDRRHGSGLLGGRFYSQVDLPRLRQVGIDGAVWVITTNPLRSASGRRRAFTQNLSRLTSLLEAHPSDVALVRTSAEYTAARASGRHAAFVGIQGGNALDESLDALDVLVPQRVVRVTLLHLYSSAWGRSSMPMSNLHSKSLTRFGRDAIARLNAARIFVDLSHISREGFFAALECHDKSLPPLVSHTGVCGAHDHWRNLTDEQIRAVTDRGGVVGIMYHTPYLHRGWRRGCVSDVVDHIEHAVAVGGEHGVALGSDWDGAIVTPRDMPTCLELPRLVQEMLNRRWPTQRIENVLGRNFLRSLSDLRG